MKLNQKITLVSVAALMTLTPALGTISSSTPVVQAAKTSQKNTIKLVKKEYGGVQLYSAQGTARNKTAKSGATLKIYGTPVLLNGPKLYDISSTNTFPQIRIIKGTSYYWLGDNGYIRTHNIGSSTRDGKLKAMFNSYIYDKNGKRLKSYRGGSALIKRNTSVQVKGQAYRYNPHYYYNVGNGNYVRVSDVAEVNGKGVMILNYNSAIYNKYGKRIKGKKTLKKGMPINYSGKIEVSDNKADFYYIKYDQNKRSYYSLSHKVIKGEWYYSIGKGQYIKAYNVSHINGEIMYTSKPTYVVPNSDMHVLNKDLQTTDKVVRAGKKVKVDGATVNGQGDNAELYYRLAGKDEYLWWGDDSEYPEDAQTEGFFKIRFLIGDESNYNDLYNSYITFKKDYEKTTPLYMANGQQRNLDGYLYVAEDGNQSAEQNFDINGAWYIWNAKENKAELYYHLTNQWQPVAGKAAGKYQYSRKTIHLGDSFVKASDVDTHGLSVKTLNTASEAEAQAKQTLTASQKNELESKISDASNIKNSDKYRLANANKRANYDGVVSDAENALKDSKTTAFEASVLLWNLDQAQSALDGAKVKVKDVDNLTVNEANQVLQVMRNANGKLDTSDTVSIYQHWAHKDGYYPSYNWVSSKKSVFMLTRSGHKNQILDVKDYATEK